MGFGIFSILFKNQHFYNESPYLHQLVIFISLLTEFILDFIRSNLKKS